MTKHSPKLKKLIERFAETPCSWMSTVRPDGRAHSAPIWHVWYEGRAYVVAQPSAVKVKNLAQNPSTVLTLPDPSDVWILEGTGAEAPRLRDAIQPLFLQKYEWNIATDGAYTTIIEITPIKLMAWSSDVTDGSDSASRWTGAELLQVHL